MKCWSEESLRAAATEEIRKIADMPEDSWDVCVVRSCEYPYTFIVYWDVIARLENGKRLCRAALIDKSESIETLHGRLRKVFDEPPQEVGIYQQYPPISMTECLDANAW